MAGAGYKLFVNGNTLSASDLNTYIQQQTVMVFTDSTARTTALSGVVSAGMISYLTGTNSLETYNGSAWVANGVGDVTLTGTQTLTNKTLTSAAINTSSMKSPREITTISATAATETINFDANTQATLYYTTSAAANFTLNVRGDSGTTLNTVMATGDSLTVTFLNTNGATPYYASAFTIDGGAITPKWQTGTAPGAGNASAIDAYTYAIFKTGSAAFTVFASQTKFA